MPGQQFYDGDAGTEFKYALSTPLPSKVQGPKGVLVNESQFLSKVDSRVEKINTDAATNLTFEGTMVTVCGESTQTREESYNPVWKEKCKRSQEMSLATLERVGLTEKCSHVWHQYKEQ